MSQEPDYRIDVDDKRSLGPIKTSDREAFVEHLNDRYIYDRTLRIPYPYTLEHADTFIDIAKASDAAVGHPLHFAIRDQHQQLIGVLGFDDYQEKHRAEIGYWIGRPFWGQGIMTSVVAASCVHATEHWNLVRITASVFDFNDASARVLEKNDFQLEGIMRKVFVKDDQFIDAKLYALVR